MKGGGVVSTVWEQIKSYLSGLYIPKIQIIDIVEIFLIAILLYLFMVWIQRTRAYTLLKGILIVGLFILAASIFQMTTILWITSRLASIALLALVIIFQPELRKALESLGKKSLITSIFPFDPNQDKTERFSDRTISEVVRAVNEMSEVRTGALIVIEQKILLTEFVNTGIQLDSLVSSQLLVNVFEHNTPLHDGAVILRGDRIVSATCYLPLSENASISKRFGTRHRAALGISEVSDAFTIVVSEETGRVSYAHMGVLTTGVTASDLREQLHRCQGGSKDKSEKKFRIWKGRDKK